MNAVEHPLHPEELMAYCDGELPPERAAAAKAHVAACSECQALADDLRRVSRDLAAWTVEHAPDSLAANARAAEPAAEPSLLRRWFSARVSYSMAGLAAVGSLIVVLILPPMFQWDQRQQTPAVVAAKSEYTARVATPSTPVEAPPPVTTFLGGVPHAGGAGQPSQGQSPSPRIARTATLSMVAKDFDAARTSLNRIVADMGGFVASLDVSGAPPNQRVLRALVRFPSAQLDAALTSLRTIGDVTQESQGSDDVTEQALDLEARIANGRHTEKRLNELLLKRTGELKDVLAAEREIARVREEIERLDAQRENLERRVVYAGVSLQIVEAEKSTMTLGRTPLSRRFRNAFIDGFSTMLTSIVEVSLVALQVAPALILWGAILGVPAYVIARRVRRPLREPVNS